MAGIYQPSAAISERDSTFMGGRKMLIFALVFATQDLMTDAAPSPSTASSADRLAAGLREIMNAPPSRSPGDVLETKLASFRGHPQQFAFNKLGYPDQKMTIGTVTIFSWINNETNVDGSPLSCTVKVSVRTGKITTANFHGNNGACALYARALDPTFHSSY